MFAQSESEIGNPVESPFGWHLFEVSAIEPETVVPLSELRQRVDDRCEPGRRRGL